MGMEKQSITKKQHYVPQMYLRNFSVNDRCYVYNPFTERIENKNIRDICEENYLYEIRDDKGDFLFPETKNEIEKALSEIEGIVAEMFSGLFLKVHGNSDHIQLKEKEREVLLNFVVIMLLRNPIFRNVLPEVYKELSGIDIIKKEEKSVVWLFTMLNDDKVAPDIFNSEIVFLETTQQYPFVTSNFPMSFPKLSIQNQLYMPLSNTIAIELNEKHSSETNLMVCRKKVLNNEEVKNYNAKLMVWSEYIISSSEREIEDCISLKKGDINDSNNPFVKANLEMIGNISPKYSLRLAKNYIEFEIDENKNHVYIEILNCLLSQGFEKEEAKMKMAEVIEEEISETIFDKKKPDSIRCQELLKKLII